MGKTHCKADIVANYIRKGGGRFFVLEALDDVSPLAFVDRATAIQSYRRSSITSGCSGTLKARGWFIVVIDGWMYGIEPGVEASPKYRHLFDDKIDELKSQIEEAKIRLAAVEEQKAKQLWLPGMGL